MEEIVDDIAPVLIVDDRPANLVALRAVLEPLGQRVVEACSGADALKHLLREDVACILLDVQMPGMDGYETAALIKQREQTRHIPILFLTAVNTEDDHAVRGYSEGAVDYIVKPYDPDVLRAKVRVFVNLWRRERHLRSQEARVYERERQLMQAEREHLKSREREARDEADRIERKLLSMTQNATVGLVMMDAHQHCVFMNPAAEALTGFTLADTKGRPLHEVVHHTRPDGRPFPIAECPIDRALPTRMREQGEDVFVRRDGSFYPVAFTASPIVEGGKAVGTVIELRDITEEKRVNARIVQSAIDLARNRAQLEAVLQAMRDGVVVFDTEGTAVFVNEAEARITGFSSAAEMKKNLAFFATVFELALPDGTPLPVDQWPVSRVMRGETLTEYELRGRRTDTGQHWYFSFSGTPVLDDDGRQLLTLIITRDVTERRKADEEREHLLGELQQAVRVRDEFLSVASHELKTPLTPLALRLAQLKRDDRLRSVGLEHVEIAEAQVRKLAVLVDGLLDVSRISEGRLALVLDHVDVAAVVRETASAMRLQAERAGSHLRIEAFDKVHGRFDRSRVAQVVVNLLSNAIKFGAGRPIHVRVRDAERAVRIEVCDEGIGVRPEDLERIFERFERGVSERHYGGLGLGLYVTRRIVRAMGGKIQVESEPGRGATFAVELPRAEEHP